MRNTDLIAFEAALSQLQEVSRLLINTDAGVCLIHLEAHIASLASRLAKDRVPPAAARRAANDEAARMLGKPLLSHTDE